MLHVKSSSDLKARIVFLEAQRKVQAQEIKAELQETVESLKPANLIKGLFSNISSSDEIKDNLITSAMSLASGYLSRKIFVGSSHNIFKNLFGGGVQVLVSKLVANNPDTILNFFDKIKNTISKFRNKDESDEQDFGDQDSTENEESISESFR